MKKPGLAATEVAIPQTASHVIVTVDMLVRVRVLQVKSRNCFRGAASPRFERRNEQCRSWGKGNLLDGKSTKKVVLPGAGRILRRKRDFGYSARMIVAYVRVKLEGMRESGYSGIMPVKALICNVKLYGSSFIQQSIGICYHEKMRFNN
jgi:hypothetical protein